MKQIVRRTAVLALACSAVTGLSRLTGLGVASASTATFPPLNPAALQAAIQTRPADDAAGAIVRVGEPGGSRTT